MPNRLWPPRRLIERRRRVARLAVARGMQQPFWRLVRHFLQRMVRFGHAEAGDLDLGIGPLLGLLAAPGAFQCLLMFDHYSSLMGFIRGTRATDLLKTSAPDKLMLISIAMAVSGMVTVLRWDSILPDAKDFSNLAPLPIETSRIFLANITAIAIGVAGLALTVNAASTILFPFFVTAAMQGETVSPGPFIAIHIVCVTLASVFAFALVFAVLGALATLLPRRIFDAWSPLLRGVLVAAFAGLLISGFGGPALIRRLEWIRESPVWMLPTMWFLGVYQILQHRATAKLAALAPMAWRGLAVVLGSMAVSYGLSYRRSYATVLEGKPRQRWNLGRYGMPLLDLFAWRAGAFDRAGYRFGMRALWRNDFQRFAISMSLALGWLLALESSFAEWSGGRPETGAALEATTLAAPLIVAYLVMVGLRLAFEAPAALTANWVFRTMLDTGQHTPRGVARRVMLALLTLLVLAPHALLALWQRGPVAAALETACVFLLSVSLMEGLIARCRKLPFTAPLPGFRQNLPVRFLLFLIGFAVFTRLGAEIERLVLATPWLLIVLAVMVATGLYWNGRREARGLLFDDPPPPAVISLNL